MKTKKTLLVCGIIAGICSLFLSIPACKKAVIPTINTTDISEVYSATAVCGGDITSDGGDDITESGVCWSSMGIPTISDSKKSSGSTNGKYKITITNLTPGTAYQVRAYAINDAGVAYGNVKTFITTLEPAVVTKPVTDISRNTAKCGGTASSSTDFSIFDRGICWSLNSTPTISSTRTWDGSGSGNFTSNLYGLEPGKTYYVRAFARNGAGIGYGETISFTTSLGSSPSLTTNNVTKLTATSVSCGGNITDEGGYEITAKGVIWSTNSNFTLSNALGNSPNTSVVENFTCEITELNINVTYYIKAYATNANGTTYGNQLSFNLTPELPEITTSAITEIHSITAISGGSISYDGGLNITNKGVCWSTSPSPTIANSHTSEGTGTSSFVSNITGLTVYTTYYVRAYATNSVGTAYGEQMVFQTQRAIGELYNGGKIAYILLPGDQGYDSQTQHGIIAPLTDQATMVKWGCDLVYLPETRFAIGTGQSNTTYLANASCMTSANAANICNDLTLNGYSDWYLPSRDELEVICQSKDLIGNFSASSANDDKYWSSSGYDGSTNHYVSAHQFSSCYEVNSFRNGNGRVRCVRSF